VKLWAISDLHVGFPENRGVVEEIPERRDDWLILAGDLGETRAHLRFVFETLRQRFRRLIWVPGNHELWTLPGGETLRGVAKYEALVATCREYDVLTPEDPYALFDAEGRPHLIVPLFTLYDYSFCPDGMTPAAARAWAGAAGVECVDEHLLHPDPYASREDWCAARCALSEVRIAQALSTYPHPTVLINHFPMMSELARLPRVPRFSIWCGTRRTADWHRRFAASSVVSGHLHMRQTRVIDGVRFEEVSLGYPREWQRRPPARTTLRQILPAPALDAGDGLARHDDFEKIR
jgi:3',5'-cyclic AMP phosphodiesterase CpdA